MRTRPASIATVVIAIGLALTAIGLARVLPYSFGGVGEKSAIAGDLWAHGTAVSPALVALAVIGLLAAIAMRPTRGGRRAASWLAVLSGVLIVAGLAETAQQQAILLGTIDVALTPLVYGLHVGLIALLLSAVGEARRPVTEDEAPASPAAPSQAGLAAAAA
jgi:xanthine/uracil permease